MPTTEEFRDDLARILDRSHLWLDELKDTSGLPEGVSDVATDVRAVIGLRTRALSTLLNVGLVGRLSSGKSFLISGLQGGLKYLQVPDGEGGFSDKYVGILPSAPTSTTACPSTVRPVTDDPSAAGRGLLEVRFADGPTGDWVRIGTDLIPATVAAYGAADGDVTNRLEGHWTLEVAEIRLSISTAALPAMLYDLPGTESVHASHEAIMRRAWAVADCFIFVSQATAEITATELTLIRDLYNHHRLTGKRVVWVLTAIDRASQLGNDNRPAWRATQDKNNAYLREHFGPSADQPDTFIGEGFVAVSPADEAKAAFEEAERNPRGAQRLRTSSRMEDLRQRLREVIEEGAGHEHLQKIAEETLSIVKNRVRPLTDLLAAHRVPVDQLEEQREDVRARLDQTNDSAAQAREQLTSDLERRIREVERAFAQLPKVLHDGLDDLIRSGDLGSEHSNEIDVRYANIITDWMNDATGPTTVWQRHMQELDAKARAVVRLHLGEDKGLVSPEPLETQRFIGEADSRRSIGIYTLVQAAAATVSLVGPVAGAATWLMTTLAAATIAIPVGALVGAGAVTSVAAKAIKDRQSAIEKAREERIEKLDAQAQSTRVLFNQITREQGQLIIDDVDASIERYRVRLQTTLQQIIARIAAPDIAESRQLVAYLEPYEQGAQRLMTELGEFSAQLA